jgi:uncharacterized membrane protein YqjE
MAITRSAPGLDLARTGSAPAEQDSDSLGELATRLAQESVALAGIELRRLGVEVRHRRHHAARVVTAAIAVTWLAAVALLALACGAALYLGRMWQDYAAGAAATGVVFLLLAGGATCLLVSASRKLTRALPDASADGPERNRTDGT